MTIPEDIMKAAREISANDWAETGCTTEAAEIRSGEYAAPFGFRKEKQL